MFIINPYVYVGFDPDALLFITNASITDSTQKTAINQLVVDLKSANIWSKMKAIYPFVGGTASQHRFNLKDPRPVAGAFYLDFYGGGTHSDNGYQPDGATAYATSYYTNLTDNLSLWYYSRTNNTTNSIEMGVYNNPYSDTALVAYYGGNSNGYIRALSNGYSGLSWVATTSEGFFGANRTSSILANTWHNGVKKGINTNTSSNDTCNRELFIGAYNTNGGSDYFSNKECAFSAISEGLTDTEASNFYTAVQSYNTTLNRQV